MSRMRTHLGELALIVASCSVSLLAGEALLRLFLRPIDYLVPDVVSDQKRSLRIRPYSAGHDARGYRNAEVPEQADVVVLGDSQTYGVGTSADSNWPRALGDRIRRSVYTLAVPGYNPLDYWSMMQEEVFAFRPKLVLVALYYGNDLREAFRSVYGKEYWRDLRQPQLAQPEVLQREAADAVVQREPPRFLGGLRRWLARHSVLYRIVTVQLKERLRIGPVQARGLAGEAIIFRDESRGIATVLTPMHRLGVLNLADPKVEDGLRITLEVLRRMQEACRSRAIPMIVVILPTKESVYWPYAESRHESPGHAQLKAVVESERRVDERVTAAFDRDGLLWIAVLPALQEAAGHEQIYPFADGHPNARGCAAIADAVKARLDALGASPATTSANMR